MDIKISYHQVWPTSFHLDLTTISQVLARATVFPNSWFLIQILPLISSFVMVAWLCLRKQTTPHPFPSSWDSVYTYAVSRSSCEAINKRRRTRTHHWQSRPKPLSYNKDLVIHHQLNRLRFSDVSMRWILVGGLVVIPTKARALLARCWISILFHHYWLSMMNKLSAQHTETRSMGPQITVVASLNLKEELYRCGWGSILWKIQLSGLVDLGKNSPSSRRAESWIMCFMTLLLLRSCYFSFS